MGQELMSKSELQVVLVDLEDVRKAERLIASCERCDPDGSSVSFDWLLGKVTGKCGLFEFLMAEFARCPICNRRVTEGTLVEPHVRQ